MWRKIPSWSIWSRRTLSCSQCSLQPDSALSSGSSDSLRAYAPEKCLYSIHLVSFLCSWLGTLKGRKGTKHRMLLYVGLFSSKCPWSGFLLQSHRLGSAHPQGAEHFKVSVLLMQWMLSALSSCMTHACFFNLGWTEPGGPAWVFWSLLQGNVAVLTGMRGNPKFTCVDNRHTMLKMLLKKARSAGSACPTALLSMEFRHFCATKFFYPPRKADWLYWCLGPGFWGGRCWCPFWLCSVLADGLAVVGGGRGGSHAHVCVCTCTCAFQPCGYDITLSLP